MIKKDTLKQTKIYIFYHMLKQLMIKPLFFLPVNNRKVVFDNFGGKGYGDDPKYIAEYLRERDKNLQLIWLTSNMSNSFPEGIHPVKYGTYTAAFHLATAKVWVDNQKSSFRVPKKKNQYYIQTWHSTLGLKKNEAEINSLSEWYVNKAKKDAKITDLMYSNNDFRLEKYKKYFWYEGNVIKCDVPRNKIFFDNNQKIKEKICDFYGIHTNQRIVLYAPTFRKSGDLSLFMLDYARLVSTFQESFGQEFVCILRLHPNDQKNASFVEYTDVLKNGSKYPDMQELLAAADVLITDYSGSMFDFSFAMKPVWLYVPDLDDYIRNERALQFSFEELPYEIASDYEELITSIRNFDEKVYLKRCADFFQSIGLEEHGKGDEVIGNIILEQCYKY